MPPPNGYQFRRPGPLQVINKAGAKDPRALVQSTPSFNPQYQPDQAQFYNKNNAEYGNMVSMPDAVQKASQSFASQTRILADYTPYPFIGNLDTNSLILIPRNNNRSDFYVINLDPNNNTIYISFGPPPPGLPGIPVFAQDFFQQTNGVTSANDIYITSPTPITTSILGYEGVPIIGQST